MSKKVILIAVILIAAVAIGYGIYHYLNSKGTREETMTIKVYFNNTNSNPNSEDCSKVYPLNRTVPKTLGVADAALTELFKGPSQEEKAQGYISWFSQNTQYILKGVNVENGIAYVNLLDIRQIIPNVSASCGSAQFLAEVETTLKQFSSVNKVIIAIEGKPSTFYEWIQVGCTQDNNFCDETPFIGNIDEEQRVKNIIEAKAAETILAIKNKDAQKLSVLANQEKGIRFSPYQHVKVEGDIVFSPAQLLSFFKDQEIYNWGVYDGSGLPINLAPVGYYNKFIYDVDFTSAPEITYNRIVSQGNVINNVLETYPNSIVVEYYFAGFDPQYEGLDWRSLELVFEEAEADWKLVGIVHGQWTI